MPGSFPISISATTEAAGTRLDQFLVSHLPETSRARIQQLIAEQKVLVNNGRARSSLKLRGNETITLLGPVQAPPLRAIPEEIALDVVYEDEDLAVINKPAGMMVHVGAGATEAARNRGTLVNALLHRFAQLSSSGGDLRPGIVHRLDKDTSGLLVVAKNDTAHRKLATQFASRLVSKNYIALVHGWFKQDHGTISASISRDLIRRIRMTTRRSGGRSAVTHYTVSRKLDTDHGKFTLLGLQIETGRTHQIRVHLASIGHPVVGDTLYGAPKAIKDLALSRNFLHAAGLQFGHPRTGETMSFSRLLPEDLSHFLNSL